MRLLLPFILTALLSATGCRTSSSYDLAQYNDELKDSRAILLGRLKVDVDGQDVYGCILWFSEQREKKHNVFYTVDNTELIALPVHGDRFSLARFSGCKDSPSPITSVSLISQDFVHLESEGQATPEEYTLIYIGDIHISFPKRPDDLGDKAKNLLLEATFGAPAHHWRDKKITVEDKLDDTLALYRRVLGDKKPYKIEKAIINPFQ